MICGIDIIYGDPSRLFLLNSTIAIDSQALKLMLDTSNPQFFPSSKCIKVLWNRKFRVYERNKTASFHTSFFFNIRPQSGIDHEGFNFMITSYDYMPNNSYGLRLGLFNTSTNDISNSKVLTFFLTYTIFMGVFLLVCIGPTFSHSRENNIIGMIQVKKNKY
jgi:hypothetical protein